MDAVEYLKEKNRMCDNCAEDSGEECMLHTKAQEVGELCSTYAQRYPAEAVAIVEQWSKDHPRKTRQSEFLKMLPRVSMTADGIIAFCPESMDSEFECPLKMGSRNDLCAGCRKKYWLEEEDDDGD